VTGPPDDRRTRLASLAWIASRAATLAERVSARPMQASSGSEAQAGADALLQFWNQAFSPQDRAAFERRLAWDGLDVPQARALAAGAYAVPPELPAWTVWLDRFAQAGAETVEAHARGGIDDRDSSGWTDEPPFVEIWTAFARAARRELGSKLSTAETSAFDPPAMATLDRQLVRELSVWGELALLEALRHSVPDEARAEPPTPASREAYETFITNVLASGGAALWDRWPVLARQLATVVGRWVETTGELVERLARDRVSIAETFGAGRDPGRVTWVAPALSDPHNGRRRVVALGFESGLKVVYKPRDLSLDEAFNSLLEWLAQAGLRSAPRALRVLPRAGYGWVEYVEAGPVATAEASRASFTQAGSLLCLAHVLHGRDFHMENVIATAEGPVLVDLEPLFQPARRLRAGPTDVETEDRPERATCLETGLLTLYEIGPDGEMFDVGGLSGQGRGVRSVPHRVWRHHRTAALAFDLERTFDVPASNTVIFEGRVQRPVDHADHIVSGFVETYELLLAEREHLLASASPLAAFARCSTRVIPRPTNQYAELSVILAAPRYQQDGLRRSAALDVLLRPFSGLESKPAVWPALVAERHALEALDIPYFWARVDDTDVWSGETVVAERYFTMSGFSAVCDRVRRLSRDDLEWQCRAIRRALAESPHSRFTTTLAQLADAESPDAQSPPFIDFALWIGHELLRLARTEHGALVWESPGGPRPPSSCPHALYDGSAGTALFLAALYRCTNETLWRDSAWHAAAAVRQALESGELAAWPGELTGSGDGLGSLVYGLVCLSELLDEPALLDDACRVAELMARRVGTGPEDVLSGSAGAILALLALHRTRPERRVIEWASAFGADLVARQQEHGDSSLWVTADGQKLLGFAHGTAGIAYALGKLGHETGSVPFNRASARGLTFVLHHFAAAEGNWPLSASQDETVGTAFMTAWCHGAPGVALALGGLAHRSDENPVLRAALATSAQWRPGRADHLCCGTLGRSEILLTLGSQLDMPEATVAARDLAEHVIRRARRERHFRLSGAGPEYRVFDPGLFRGLSGIGYALLRLSSVSHLPAVLAFEAPARNASSAPHI